MSIRLILIGVLFVALAAAALWLARGPETEPAARSGSPISPYEVDPDGEAAEARAIAGRAAATSPRSEALEEGRQDPSPYPPDAGENEPAYTPEALGPLETD